MKAKLLKVFTVCVVTLVVLSPELVVFGIVWKQHIELVKVQKLASEVNQISTLNLQQKYPNYSSSQTNTKSSPQKVVNQMLTIAEQYQFAAILQWFFFLTPVCIGLGIIFYDRYLVYRAAVLKEQIEMLERLWQQSIEQ